MSTRCSCCACGKTSYKYPSLSFHKIPPPSRSQIRQESIARLRIPPRIAENPAGNYRVCSQHFRDDCYESKMECNEVTGRYEKFLTNRLLKDALPTSMSDDDDDETSQPDTAPASFGCQDQLSSCNQEIASTPHSSKIHL